MQHVHEHGCFYCGLCGHWSEKCDPPAPSPTPSRNPPCPSCGQETRLFVEHARFGCDRCQRLIGDTNGLSPAPLVVGQRVNDEKLTKKHWLGIGVFTAGLVIVLTVAFALEDDDKPRRGGSDGARTLSPSSSDNSVEAQCFKRNQFSACQSLLRQYTDSRNFAGAKRVMFHCCDKLNNASSCFLAGGVFLYNKPSQPKVVARYWAKACRLFKAKASLSESDRKAMTKACSGSRLLGGTL